MHRFPRRAAKGFDGVLKGSAVISSSDIPSGQLWVIRYRNEARSWTFHVGYRPESGSKIGVLASAPSPLRVDDVARRVIQAPKPEPQITRYELTDYESAAIKPFLPNEPRGVARVTTSSASLKRGHRIVWTAKGSEDQSS